MSVWSSYAMTYENSGKAEKMKKPAWIIGIVIIAFIGFLAAPHFFTVSNIKTSIVEKDSEKLSENVLEPLHKHIGNYK